MDLQALEHVRKLEEEERQELIAALARFRRT
jgi:hypothetical protein